MRALKQDGISAGRVGSGYSISTHSVDEGPYRLRPAADVPWPGAYGHTRRETVGRTVVDGAAAVLRLVVPVLVLLGCASGVYLYRDTPAPLTEAGMDWITAAHLIVPVAFFCVFMTNRRYGPAYAFAQVVISSAIVAGMSVFGRDTMETALAVAPIPVREAVAFGAAFFLASFISIVVFDGTRGANWFTAPLFGFLSAAIVFAAVYFPLAGETPWFGHAVQYAALVAGEGVLLLVPYYILRGVIPPVSGFGGY